MGVPAVFLMCVMVLGAGVFLAAGIFLSWLKNAGGRGLRFAGKLTGAVLKAVGVVTRKAGRRLRGAVREKRARRFREAAVDGRMLTTVPPGPCNTLVIIGAAREILSRRLRLDIRLLAASVPEHKFVAIAGRGDLGFALVSVRYNANHERVPSKAAATRRFLLQYHLLPGAEHGRVRIIAAMHPMDTRPSAEVFEGVARMELLGDDLLPIYAAGDLGIHVSRTVAERVVLSTSPAFREDTEPTAGAHRRSE